MQVIPISSIEEFLQMPLWDTHTMIFRGVSDAAYDLIPSLGRVPVKDSATLLLYEDRLISEFKRRSLPYLKDGKPTSFLNWLCLAQHYGIPTRLLDWTTNPLIALYFAAEKHPDRDFAVYKHVQSLWYEGDSPVTAPEINVIFGIQPPHFDYRFINQDGVFTVHPEPASPFEGDHIVKYVFPSAVKEKVGWQLRKFGFRPSRIYPGLDGVSKDIIEDLATCRSGMVRSSGGHK